MNYHANMPSVSTTVSMACVSPSAYPGLGLPPCNVYPSCPSGCNMMQVTSTATVPTLFAKIFGINSVPITATGVASARGGGIPPYHIMIVLDTTASMGPPAIDTGCTQNGTSVTPSSAHNLASRPCCCNSILRFGRSGLPAQYRFARGGQESELIRLGLMVFPGLCNSSTAGYNNGGNPCPQLAVGSALTNTTVNAIYPPADLTCPAGTPTQTSYNNNPDYLILGFQGNYRSSTLPH